MAALPVPEDKLREAIAEIIESDDLSHTTAPILRSKLESKFGLNKDSLSAHRDLVSSLMNDYINTNLKQSEMDDLDLWLKENIDEEESDDNHNHNRKRKDGKSKTNQKHKDPIGIMHLDFSKAGNSKYWDFYTDAHGRKYSIMLNQTDINFGVRGHNKFYAIQLLEHKEGNLYKLVIKWGRVGTRGQSSEDMMDSKSVAIEKFRKKFKDKTKNEWGTRKFVAVKGKYVPVAMQEGSANEEDSEDDVQQSDIEMDDDDGKDGNDGVPLPTVDNDVVKMLKLIFSKQLQQDTVKALDYDINNAPLGQLGAKQITKGYNILRKISDLINDGALKHHDKLSLLTNQYYTTIPHSFGGRLPPIIKGTKRLHRELDLIEALRQMAVTNKILKKRHKRQHPIDTHYNALRCDISPVPSHLREYQAISKAVAGTHASTHNRYTLEIKNIFEINRRGSEFRHLPFRKAFTDSNREDGNCKLLWHGSRLSNFVGILSQGLRIAPPEAPVTGYMFGKGIYFADCVSKSANYVHATKDMPYGMLILCEVACGNMYPVLKEKYMDRPPIGYHSTKGVGKTVPKEDETSVVDIDGYKLAVGPLVKNEDGDVAERGSLLYNEFIVYDIAQVRMKYVVLCRFDFVDDDDW